MSKSGRTASSSPIFVISVSQTPIPVVYTFEYGLGGRLLLSQMSGERTVMSVRQDLIQRRNTVLQTTDELQR